MKKENIYLHAEDIAFSLPNTPQLTFEGISAFKKSLTNAEEHKNPTLPSLCGEGPGEKSFHMKKYALLAIFIVCNCCLRFCYAQTTIITGTIKDTKGERVSHLSVTLRQVSDSALLSYAYSNDTGNYKLSYSGEEKELLVVVSGLGIATEAKKIQNSNQAVDFVVKEAVFQLREVEIKPQKIYYSKDTLNYLVSEFMDGKDFVIGDVLKKMPGIEVSNSGKISVQGKPINKFYIENMDLLNGRYGIATQNISAKDVATVQVLENHQPIKALDSVRIADQAAINLKLKDSAKGTLSIMAQLGIGASPLLWNNALTGMYFAKGKQNITAYKTNNTGNNLTNELRSFTTSFDLSPDKVTNIQMPSPPDISRNRYLFNNSNAFTTNNLFTVGKNKELSLNIIYYNDYEKRESEARSSYFITGDSLLRINENIRSFTNTNRIETEMRYNENDENRYVNDLLNLEGSWENGKGVLTESAIGQDLYRPSLKIQNAFHFIKRSGSAGFEINSQTGFISTPQRLTITPGLYAGLLNNGEDYFDLRQDARANTFVSNNSLIFLSPLVLGKFFVNPIAGFMVEMDELHSDLYPRDILGNPLDLVPDGMRNKLNRNQYSSRIGLNVDYRIDRFKFSALLPLNYRIYSLKNRIDANNSENLNKFSFEPALKIQYIPSQKVDINANLSFYNRMNGIQELYSGYLLQTYRNLNRYDSRFAASEGSNYSLDIKYKDILKMLFVNANIAYNRAENSVTYIQTFEENLLLTSYVKQPNETNTTIATGKISKGLDWMQFTSDFGLTYLTSTSQQIRQNQLVDSKIEQTGISCRLSAVPVSFIILTYSGEWQQSRSEIELQKSFPVIHSLTNTLTLDFTLFKKIRMGSQLEHYYNNAVQGDKQLYFADLSLHYVWKQANFELACNNLFNTKYYTRAYYSDLNTYRYNYVIRPSSVLFKVKFKLK
ncbi:MAG: TonB-dependent receptor [Dysgonamonadaceae bacterium]|jgi:hypothetical protein|nr:TonB-dependent receptor [Dysgonamonadaceae bacterium]